MGTMSRSTSSSLLGFVSKSCAEHEEEAYFLLLNSDVLMFSLAFLFFPWPLVFQNLPFQLTPKPFTAATNRSF